MVVPLGGDDVGARVGGGSPVSILAVGGSGVGGRVESSVGRDGDGDVGDMVGVAITVGNIVDVGGFDVGGRVGTDVGGDHVGATAGVANPVGNIVAVGGCVGGSVGEHVSVVRWQLHSRVPRAYADAPQGQPSKAKSPMDVIESGITIVARLVQPEKAPPSMDVTESAIQTVARLVQLPNA